jgi:hypothetical protein
MSMEHRLARLEMRQEALVSAMNGLADIMVQTRDLVGELMLWLQEPPSSDLSDTLKTLAKVIEEQSAQLKAIGGVLIKLPAQVARAARTGEP